MIKKIFGREGCSWLSNTNCISTQITYSYEATCRHALQPIYIYTVYLIAFSPYISFIPSRFTKYFDILDAETFELFINTLSRPSARSQQHYKNPLRGSRASNDEKTKTQTHNLLWLTFEKLDVLHVQPCTDHSHPVNM